VSGRGRGIQDRQCAKLRLSVLFDELLEHGVCDDPLLTELDLQKRETIRKQRFVRTTCGLSGFSLELARRGEAHLEGTPAAVGFRIH
jgi:hypothetical protein